jgi:ATP-dependent RNA helicase DDX3X
MSDRPTFGTEQMARALSDVTNTSVNNQDSKSKPTGADPAAAGWTKKVAYDYETYNASGEEARAAEERAAKEDGETGRWASNAAKYEWDEDFGDVGPANPRLEAQLFGDEHITRAGQQVQV